MAKIFFDTQNGFLQIDGKTCDRIDTPPRADFAALYMADTEDALPVLCRLTVKDGKLRPGKLFYTLDCGNDTFVVSFRRRSYEEFSPPSPYFQLTVGGSRTHWFTAFRRGDYRYCIETADEIYEAVTPMRLENIRVTATPIAGGDLITADADCAGKRFLAVLSHCGDYVPLLTGVFDSFCQEGDDLVLTDCLDDMLKRTVTRRLRYENGAYREIERTFEYGYIKRYPDELLPYLYAESAFCGDNEMLRRLSHPDLADASDLLGNFDSVFSHPAVDVPPHCVGLIVPRDENFAAVSYFRFRVEDGLIRAIEKVS